MVTFAYFYKFLKMERLNRSTLRRSRINSMRRQMSHAGVDPATHIWSVIPSKSIPICLENDALFKKSKEHIFVYEYMILCSDCALHAFWFFAGQFSVLPAMSPSWKYYYILLLLLPYTHIQLYRNHIFPFMTLYRFNVLNTDIIKTFVFCRLVLCSLIT